MYKWAITTILSVAFNFLPKKLESGPQAALKLCISPLNIQELWEVTLNEQLIVQLASLWTGGKEEWVWGHTAAWQVAVHSKGQERAFSLLGWRCIPLILTGKPTSLKSYDTAQTWRVLDIKCLWQFAWKLRWNTAISMLLAWIILQLRSLWLGA